MNQTDGKVAAPIIVPVSQKEREQNDWFKKNKDKLIKSFNRKKEITKKKEKVLLKTPGILPYLDIDEDGDIETKTGFMTIFQIQSVDIVTLNDEDVQRLIMGRAKFMRSYSEDIKEVAMNFPVNTEIQQTYIAKKINSTENPQILKHLKRKLYQLEYLEKNRVNLEYYLFIFSDSKENLKDRKESAKRLLRTSNPLREISNQKKIDILFKINNQNSKIL